ncbi:MAG: hypothetical protein LBJ64_00445 [Deltaproteobacteria bacterium]|nr:hypothetical protein [Deltaproteobacteria bacterium]
MAFNVKQAFAEFMKESVNLDAGLTAYALKCRNALLANISEFNARDGFFNLWENFSVHCGALARKTQCRELDDIDLMIGLLDESAKYCLGDPWHDARVIASPNSAAHRKCNRDCYLAGQRLSCSDVSR